MPSMSDTKARILDMFSFVREQIAFIKETTKFIVNPDDFVTTQNGMVLFNPIGMLNIIAHEYASIDHDRIFNTIGQKRKQTRI